MNVSNVENAKLDDFSAHNENAKLADFPYVPIKCLNVQSEKEYIYPKCIYQID